MTRRLSPLLAALVLAGCPWIPEDVHDQFNGDDDDDSEVVDADTDCEDVVLFVDSDEDGWGADRADACDPPARTATRGGDCDDTDETVNPDAIEFCDGIDNDCNDQTTEDGLASARNPLTGEQFDVTEPLTSGDFIGVSTDWLEVDVQMCTGTYNATFGVQAAFPIVTLRGLGDVRLNPAANDRTLYVETGTLIVENMTLGGGTRTQGGGTALCTGGQLELRDVFMDGGTAPQGAGIFASTCTVAIEDSTIEQTTGQVGSYMVLTDSSVATIEDTDFLRASGESAFLVSGSTLNLTRVGLGYNSSTGINLSNSGQFSATVVDFPTRTGADVVTRGGSFNFGTGYSGTCNDNGCTSP